MCTPCDQQQLTALGARLGVRAITRSPSEEGRTVGGRPHLAPRQLSCTDGLLQSSVTGRMRSEASLIHPRPSRSTGAHRRQRVVGDGLGSWPHRWCSPRYARAGRRAAQVSGSIDAGEPCVGGLVEDEDGSLGAGSGERCGGAPLEDRESSTRCRQSLEEAQAAMLSSGSLHFGSPRVQPGFPIRPSARSSEVSPFLPASAVVRLPHT